MILLVILLLLPRIIRYWINLEIDQITLISQICSDSIGVQIGVIWTSLCDRF